MCQMKEKSYYNEFIKCFNINGLPFFSINKIHTRPRPPVYIINEKSLKLLA